MDVLVQVLFFCVPLRFSTGVGVGYFSVEQVLLTWAWRVCVRARVCVAYFDVYWRLFERAVAHQALFLCCFLRASLVVASDLAGARAGAGRLVGC